MKSTIVNRLIAVMALLACAVATFAAPGTPGWLEEKMYASGKINTVVMVVGVVLVGIAAWLFSLDRRLGNLEKRFHDRSTQHKAN